MDDRIKALNLYKVYPNALEMGEDFNNIPEDARVGYYYTFLDDDDNMATDIRIYVKKTGKLLSELRAKKQEREAANSNDIIKEEIL